MTFVLDASLALAFIFQDEASPRTDAILESLGQGASAWVPALWRWEVANVLLLAERHKRIAAADAHGHLTALQMLPIEVDESAPREAWKATLLMARAHKLSVYDAAYLEIAIRRGIPLGSLDAQLRSAAKSERVKRLPEEL